MAESRLVIGPKISDASSANSLFTTRHFALPEFHHHYLFHVEFTVTDQHFNAPGVFPRHNIRLTTDMFPLTRTWYQVSVGPLLAKSTAELVFLSLVEGNIQTGIASRIGLIRVSTLSAPEALDGEQLGSPLLGEIEVGDLSKWKRWHQPILERHVCSSFPESHRSPVATMYDFRVLNYVACVPALIAHLLQHTPSRSDSGYSQSDHHTPSASRDNIDDEKIEEHRTSNFTPLSIDDNPLMRYLSSAYAAESSETSGTYLNAGDSRHPVPRFNHGITPRSPSPQKPGASLSGIAPAYHRIPHQHYGGTSYTSIASVLDRQYNYSQNGGVDHSLLFYSVDRAIKMCRRCMLHMSTGWYTLCSTDKPLGPHQTPANGASTSLATSFVNGEKMKKKRRHTAADKAANNERGETAKWKKVEERRSQGTLPGW